jgi:hypothetical protein
LKRPKSPTSFKKTNYVGVEIEMIMRCSSDYLMESLADAKLGRYVHIKSDGSLRPTETHRNCVELTVLAEEGMIKQVISSLCEVLRKKRIDAIANNSCGLHVHLDMRNRDAALCYNNLYYTQNIITGMVPANRREKDNAEAARFCRTNESPDIKKQVQVGDRYRVINPLALSQHKTLEVRVHSGSTNAMKINNWIDVLLSVVNSETKLVSHIKDIGKFAAKFGISSDLQTYIQKRTDKFSDLKIDTTADQESA